MRVLMWVGDNIQDFPHLSQDIRKQGDAAFADFGEGFVVLPNPMYGSWTRNSLP
jgi:predicted secreted acid phosphatase